MAILFVAALAIRAGSSSATLDTLADTTVLLLLFVFVVRQLRGARAAQVTRRGTTTSARQASFPSSVSLACAALIVDKVFDDLTVFLYAGGLIAIGIALWAINRAAGRRR